MFKIATVQTKVSFGSRRYFRIIAINCHNVFYNKGANALFRNDSGHDFREKNLNFPTSTNSDDFPISPYSNEKD